MPTAAANQATKECPVCKWQCLECGQPRVSPGRIGRHDNIVAEIAEEVAWFDNPVIRIADLATGITRALENPRRPGVRSVALALRALGYERRSTRVKAWNDGEPVSAWCKDWSSGPDSREPYAPDTA